MEDIRLAIGLIGFVSAAVFCGFYRWFRNSSNFVLNLAAAGIVILIGVYVRTVWGQLWIVRYIPLPSVIILSNWFPVLLSALAAIVWIRLGSETASAQNPPKKASAARHPSEAASDSSAIYWGRILRRIPVMAILLAASVYSLLYFVPSEPPECGNEWEYPRVPLVWPICKQTTPYTCSAAAAATILNTLEIGTSEQQMARLCLTKSGTTWLGLYHGLSTMLLGTDHRVEFFSGDLRKLQDNANGQPVLLCCRLDPDIAARFPEYQEYGGWIPGTAHTVVYFRPLADYHIVGDPSRGYEVWTTEDLKRLWTGDGLRLGIRPGVNPPAAE